MVEIKDSDGKVVRRSANLRGLRAHIGQNWVKLVSIKPIGTPRDGARPYVGCDGELTVQFGNGDTCTCDWASFTILCESLINWRNLYGAKLEVCGLPSGEVECKNEELNRHSR